MYRRCIPRICLLADDVKIDSSVLSVFNQSILREIFLGSIQVLKGDIVLCSYNGVTSRAHSPSFGIHVKYESIHELQ